MSKPRPSLKKLGERSEGEATEVYEAQCRAWADRAGVAIDEVVEEMDVSGATAVAERKLERLLQRVEGGESEGIITPYLDRFGRDLIEGALAYRRLRLAGGRLVCVKRMQPWWGVYATVALIFVGAGISLWLLPDRRRLIERLAARFVKTP